jgi:hypothetical protein
MVGRANIESGQRSQFATSAASSLLSTIHQQLKIHRANLLLNRSLVFTVQEETIVTLTMLVTAQLEADNGLKVEIVHTREGRVSCQCLGPRRGRSAQKEKKNLS